MGGGGGFGSGQAKDVAQRFVDCANGFGVEMTETCNQPLGRDGPNLLDLKCRRAFEPIIFPGLCENVEWEAPDGGRTRHDDHYPKAWVV